MSEHRLVWSSAASDRIRLISRARLHVYIEGENVDPYFYGEFCRRECKDRFDYRLVHSGEIAGVSRQGKEGLIEEFVRLRRQRLLSGETFTTIFFLDKDIDDILRRRKRSPHVHYTTTYNVEGELYRNSAIEDAVAAATWSDPLVIRGRLGHGHLWVEQAALRWKPWVVLCVFAHLIGGSDLCGFGRSYPVHRGRGSITDALIVLTLIAESCRRSGKSIEGCRRAMRSASRVVEARYRTGRAHEIFNGKWYAILLDDDVQQLMPGRTAPGSLQNQLLQALAGRLDFDAAWSSPYRSRIRELLAAIA